MGISTVEDTEVVTMMVAAVEVIEEDMMIVEEATTMVDIEDRVITMEVEGEVGMSNRTVEETIQAAMLISVDAIEEIQTGDLHLITISESQPQKRPLLDLSLNCYRER